MEPIDYAIRMEIEGEQYYREQAHRNGKNSLSVVFSMLADEEANHANILRDKAQGNAYRSEGAVRSIRDVFTGLGDFKMDTKAYPDQVDAYRMALEKEKQSIDLYREMKSEMGNEDGLFDFLLGQEQQHFAILEQIVEVVNRPNEWVESAEFGRRNEY